MSENGEKRQVTTFSNRFGLLAATIGGAVGLGNLWGFPAKLGRGGGFYFLVIYLVLMLAIGIPMTVTEYSIGRTTRKGPIATYQELCRKFTWVGWFNEATCVLVMGFFVVITGWVLHYTVMAFLSIFGMADAFWEADGATYFGNFVSNTPQLIIWTVISLVLVWLLMRGNATKGIERSCKVMIPLLAIMLVIVCVRSVTLPGASAGLEYLFKPNMDNVAAIGGIGAAFGLALSQLFFSLNVGFGTNLTYGTMIADDIDMPQTSVIVPICDTIMATLAAIATIPACMAFGFEPTTGGGMLFIVMKQTFMNMPAGKIFAFLFFLCVSFAALSTAIGINAAIIKVPQDHWGWSEGKALNVSLPAVFPISLVCMLGYGAWSDVRILSFIGKDYDLLDSIDFVAENTIATIGALGLVIFAGWVWKPENIFKECERTKPVGAFFKNYVTVGVKFIAPPIVLIVVLMSVGLLTF